jgi:hypothetical protein
MARPTLRLCVKLLACTALVGGCTVAYAEPLFFDCHGTYQKLIGPREPHGNEDPDYQPKEVTWTVMIDPDKGAVEGPGIKSATNEYCARESDWMPCGTGGANKVVKECTTLGISETSYGYTATSESRSTCQFPQLPPVTFHNWTAAGLNRITGEFYAQIRTQWGSDKTGNDLMTIDVWKMTCVKAQRKF